MADGGQTDYAGGKEIPGLTAEILAKAQTAAASAKAAMSPYSASAGTDEPMPLDIPVAVGAPEPAKPAPVTDVAATPPAPAVAPPAGDSPATADGGASVVGQKPADPGIGGMLKDLIDSNPMMGIAFAFFAAMLGKSDSTATNPEQQLADRGDLVMEAAEKANGRATELKEKAGDADFHTAEEMKKDGFTPEALDMVIMKKADGTEIAAVVLKNKDGELSFVTGERDKDGKAITFNTKLDAAELVGVVDVNEQNSQKLREAIAPAPEVATSERQPIDLAEAVRKAREGAPLANVDGPQGAPPPVVATAKTTALQVG